jgi:hypothetical protein
VNEDRWQAWMGVVLPLLTATSVVLTNGAGELTPFD